MDKTNAMKAQFRVDQTRLGRIEKIYLYMEKKKNSYSMTNRKNSFKTRVFRKSHIHKGVMLSANSTVVYTPDISFCSLFFSLFKSLDYFPGTQQGNLNFPHG